jgi:hypothetical protein
MFTLGGTGTSFLWSQSNELQVPDAQSSYLFFTDEPLGLRLSYSAEDLIKISNDSTYIPCDLAYRATDETWNVLSAEIRVRGGFRRTYCHYTPLKLKIGTQRAEGTPFHDARKPKLVLLCLKSKKAEDDLLKEFMAYRIYEVLSPYHFKTRLLDLELEETRKDKLKTQNMKGFLIQDDESFATMNNGKEIERFINYDAQDEKIRVTNALFQYMIGNTDFSTVYLHNEKLFYVDDKIVPVPYDFDMSGLVDASYAVVSKVQNEVLPITKVTNRLYRGFTADEQTMLTIRQEFIEKKEEVFQAIDQLEPYFSDPREFHTARDYIEGFYGVLSDDKKFKKRMVDKSRSK